MLYMSMGGKLTRIHGPFVSDEEVAKVTGFLRSNYKTEYADIYADFNENIEDEVQDGVLKSSFNYSSIGTTPSKVAKEDKDDNLYQSAVDVVMTDKRTSISYIQRKLRIGYNTAARMVEKMEEDGILSAPDHLGKRVIMKK
jgi:S-DNA-T family DNA segregation ATPase FtsK/SpoIIIE